MHTENLQKARHSLVGYAYIKTYSKYLSTSDRMQVFAQQKNISGAFMFKLQQKYLKIISSVKVLWLLITLT